MPGQAYVTSDPLRLRAAQYVRMSPYQQKYSIENQAAAIAAYATEGKIDIVQTYVDKGRSGLRINSRKDLQRLIGDVQERRADFDVILVYDVSRWGRFQDVDESAYYEFICKKAGIQVLYRAEQFENDGSFVSAIMKNIRRVAAGDYSRDLSARVFAGSCRIITLGFKTGGTAGYGLQRVLVDQFGTERCVLKPGDRKSLHSDRVVLRPGPPKAVKIVQEVFCSFVRERKSELEIARELNRRKILNEFGRQWRMLAIRRLLTDEKYLGNYVYNRKSGKLKTPRKPNPEAAWVRNNSAFEAIIDPVTFAEAGKIIAARPRRTLRTWKSNRRMLELLKAKLQQQGRLTAQIIDSSPELPCTMTFICRFGTLRRAYELIAYNPDTLRCYESRRAVRASTKRLADELVRLLQHATVSATFDLESSRLTVAPGFSISILIVRCQCLSTGALRWPVRRRIDRSSTMALAARMQQDNTFVLDYHLIPNDRLPRGNITFRRTAKGRLDNYRQTALEAVADVILRKVDSIRQRQSWRVARRTNERPASGAS
jgi:DNA invertase Pin-like site-specific DNA recombinase